jgi:hypothetical protein
MRHVFFFPSSQITGDSHSANTTSHKQTKIPASINTTSHKQNRCVSFSFCVCPLARFFVWLSHFVLLLVRPPVALGALFAFVFTRPVLIRAHPFLFCCSRRFVCAHVRVPRTVALIMLFVHAPFLSCCSHAVFACVVALIALFARAPFLSCCLHCLRSSPCRHVACSLLFVHFSLLRCLLHSRVLCRVHLALFPKILSCIETIVFQCRSNPGMFARILSCIEMLSFHCRFNPGMFARNVRNIPILLESYPNAQRLDI